MITWYCIYIRCRKLRSIGRLKVNYLYYTSSYLINIYSVHHWTCVCGGMKEVCSILKYDNLLYYFITGPILYLARVKSAELAWNIKLYFNKDTHSAFYEGVHKLTNKGGIWWPVCLQLKWSQFDWLWQFVA